MKTSSVFKETEDEDEFEFEDMMGTIGKESRLPQSPRWPRHLLDRGTPTHSFSSPPIVLELVLDPIASQIFTRVQPVGCS
jgi:hypothetical protein